MSVIRGLANLSKICVACAGLVATFLTVVKLMYFLSDPQVRNYETTTDNFWVGVSRKLLQNSALLSLFIIQHSLTILPSVKRIFEKLHLLNVQRSFYVICTCLALQLLMKYWCSIPEISVWQFNTRSKSTYWAFLLAHLVAWFTIYVGNICMDLNELLGIKQVYYSIKGLPHPDTLKSKELLKLYAHMRHPSVTAFLVIFWLVPFMTLDKLYLAVILTLYMFHGWKTDAMDYHYQKTQFNRKFTYNHYQYAH